MRQQPRARNLLCVVPYPTNTGFAWNYIEGLYARVADNLGASGVETYVAYTSVSALPRTLAGSKARPVELDARLGTFRSLLQTARFVRKHRIGTLYMTDTGMWSLAFPVLRMLGVSWIVSHDHTSGHRTPPIGLKSVAKWIKARLPWFPADRILTVSEYVTRRQVDVALNPPWRVVTAINGITPPEHIGPVPQEIQSYRSAGRPIVTCISRAAEEKGVHVLMRAFDLLLQNWDGVGARPVLVYVGDGPYMSSLVQLRHSLASGKDMVLLGYQPDPSGILASADVCVVPSLWEDACPLGVLEPMSLGKPVVATRVGGVPEEIGDSSCGILVPKGDPAALADAIGTLLGDSALRERIGACARERIERVLTVERQIDLIVRTLYGSVESTDSDRLSIPAGGAPT